MLHCHWLLSVSGSMVSARNSFPNTHFMCAATVPVRPHTFSMNHSVKAVTLKRETLWIKKERKKKKKASTCSCPEISISLWLLHCLDKVRLAAGIRLAP